MGAALSLRRVLRSASGRHHQPVGTQRLVVVTRPLMVGQKCPAEMHLARHFGHRTEDHNARAPGGRRTSCDRQRQDDGCSGYARRRRIRESRSFGGGSRCELRSAGVRSVADTLVVAAGSAVLSIWRSEFAALLSEVQVPCECRLELRPPGIVRAVLFRRSRLPRNRSPIERLLRRMLPSKTSGSAAEKFPGIVIISATARAMRPRAATHRLINSRVRTCVSMRTIR